MGWFVWIVDSVAFLVASYAVAVATYPDRSVLDRFLLMMLVDTALILTALVGTGLLNHLEPVTLGITSLAMAGVTFAVARKAAPAGAIERCLRSDLGAPRRLALDIVQEREVSALVLIIAAMAVVITGLMIWYFRSWTWDPVWYHVPETSYVIQDHSMGWIDTPNWQTQGNPRNGEMLAVWNCVFQRDNRLDDSSQWPFLFVGAAVTAAWCRRVGATRALSAAAGATWITFPPVYLQAHSTHVDVIWNSLFVCAIYFTLGKPERRDRWVSFLAWGLFLGTKYTAIFHMGLWAPWLLGRAAVELRNAQPGKRGLLTLDIAASGLFAVGLGCWKYIQNFVHMRNPMWPWEVKVQRLGILLPGAFNPRQEYGSGPDESPTFFGAPNAVKDLIGSWFNDDPFYCPDVRSGGFGAAFRWLILWCVVAVAFDMARGRNWRRGTIPILLFLAALCVPVPYMTRFVLSAGCAALVCFAIVMTDIRSRAIRTVIGAALVALSLHAWNEGWRGFIVFPRYFRQSVQASPVVRSALQIDTFLWPTEHAMMRERELSHGEVFAYDDTVHFLGDLFNHDYSNRVVYVSSAGAPMTYACRLEAMHAKWVGVAWGSPAARTLESRGAEFLFAQESMAVYRMPVHPNPTAPQCPR